LTGGLDYFDDITDEKIPKDMLDLVSHIVEKKAGHFDPTKFDDRYEDALKDLLRKKQEGKPIERPERREPTNVVNLMDALRCSVDRPRNAVLVAVSEVGIDVWLVGNVDPVAQMKEGNGTPKHSFGC
jgi:non-homologous end joining protein Ku